ncbi:helix-turn-helix domain-containing protein [Ruminococcus albus]|nr:helix-turn-helix transcriptional regulator [Ruminococcus albus]MCC3351593.1 helix-turn-helix domain-containing protein [Ruminococcus albus 8]
MNITIGNKIKELRQRGNLTQEELGEALGVSFQAVSKWENNIALPDIALVPTIAIYFGVSIDELFDYSKNDIDQAVNEICSKAYEFRESDPLKSRAILEKGLEQYPDNEIIMNNMLYVINYSEDPDETIKLASKLIERTADSEVRYDSLRFLAYAYKAKGDIESAVAAIEQIPEIYFSKLTEIAFLFDGEKKIEAATKERSVSLGNLLQMQQKIVEYYAEIGDKDKARAEIERALELLEVMSDLPVGENYKGFLRVSLKSCKL